MKLENLQINNDIKEKLDKMGWSYVGQIIPQDEKLFVSIFSKNDFCSLVAEINRYKAGLFWEEENHHLLSDDIDGGNKA